MYKNSESDSSGGVLNHQHGRYKEKLSLVLQTVSSQNLSQLITVILEIFVSD